MAHKAVVWIKNIVFFTMSAYFKNEMNKQWPFLIFSKIAAHKIYVKMDITNCFIYNYGYKNQML